MGPAGRVRRIVRLEGLVQGVGFRPYVFNLARRLDLGGWVLNSSRGVILEVEGAAAVVDTFLSELGSRPPRLARIASLTIEAAEPVGYEGFEIRVSQATGPARTQVSPDVATCPRCAAEVADRSDRRYRYPFTNCTDCGPRFTIVQGVPYDRPLTTMRGFTMCPACQREYDDPGDRRFHAQPNACPVCGPRVRLVDGAGRELGPAGGAGWVAGFGRLMREGRIVAVKGIGGYHLACDALNPAAVAELRRRKQRPHKPLAVMARDVATARRYCHLEAGEAEALRSPEAPIVVLRLRDGVELPGGLAPGNHTLGVMLPYTPLHRLLFEEGPELLVLTSGNARDLPLVKDEDEAFRELGVAADCFLMHDRPIEQRCDDSLGRVFEGEFLLYRRSRGYVPRPLPVPLPVPRPAAGSPSPGVLGAGAELKNTFCLLTGRDGRGQAFFGPHQGEMGYEECLANYRSNLASLQRLVDIEPRVVAHDLHPACQVSRLAAGLPVETRVGVQHHHAHLAACLAEHGLEGPALGVACDGTGYGTDGRIWGFEVLGFDYRDFTREAHLEYLPLPGGDAATARPLRIAAAYLAHHFGDRASGWLMSRFPAAEREITAAASLARRAGDAAIAPAVPRTSSCGRLFDAVSAMLGVCQEVTYEGQAAVELEQAVAPGEEGGYGFEIRGGRPAILGARGVLAGVMADIDAGEPPGVIAARFHNSVAAMIAAGVEGAVRRRGWRTVVLSGGTFQNVYLLARTLRRLRQLGLDARYHRSVPTNDGGLALGQAMVAAWRIYG